ncbi:F193A protein, partial [Acromyrmex insinuator]
MSGSDGEDGRLEKSTTTTATTTVATITGKRDIIEVMGDDGGSTATVMKRHCNDVIAVDSCTDSAWTCRDTDTPSDHENGDARVFPAVADYDPTGCGTTDQRVIDAFIRGARAADEDRRKSSLVSTDALAKLYSSATAMDSQSERSKNVTLIESILCMCRDMFREELQKAMNFQNLWTELRQYIRTDFNVALETHTYNSPQSHCGKFTNDMHNTVIQLCKRDSHQLFMRLVSQAQEFVIEVKIRLFALLHDRSVNLAEIFLTGLLNDYDALVSTAIIISELVKPLKKCLNFNLTWDCFIKKLYQIYVYNDALVQNNLPTFIGQLRKLLPLKGSKYQALVHRYLSFDDEMTRIGNLWPETEPWMDKYNAEQAVRMTRLRQIREAWELFTATRKFMERSMLNKTSDIGNEMQEIHGQFSSLIAHTSGSDSPPLSPVLDFSSDSIAMPSSIEIVQILLDDWNKAQHQKLADIAGALTATEVDAAGQGDSNCYDYTRATCQLAQYAIRSVRTHNDDSGDMENGFENRKECECYTCNETGISHTDTYKDENAERDEINSLPSLSNGFLEIPTSCTQVKKKIDNLNDEDKKKKESGVRDTLHKYIGSKTPETEPCLCVYQHAQEITERKKEILESPPCPCLLNSRRKWDICPCLPKSIPETVVANGRPKATSPTSIVKTNPEPSEKPVVKTAATQPAQTQMRHSTTQTHNHTMHQGNTHSHGLLPDLTKNTVSSGDGDCSDSGSSQGDSCSTSSSAQRDANIRHCDCCYCEVFGHGMPSVAPVSRNYKEMRERLRQLLTKKKAKKCKTVAAGCSPQKSPSESSIPNANSESKTMTNSILRSNTPISTTSTTQYDQRDQRDLEELLEFIEGNQSGKKDNKKAEKKARQKQRKLEEKLKKDRQEAERQKLIELQKKTPEVTITVVDPQKPVPQRLLPQCNLPEVSILPTSSSVSLPTIKPLNNRKKDKQEVCSNNSNNCGSNSIISLSNKTKTMSANSNAKNKINSINSTEKCEVRNMNSTQGNKSNAKVDSNKGSKLSASINNVTKNNSNNANKLSDVNLLDKKLTKKERKKLKKEMKKLEEAKAKETESTTHTESQPQIVTIRREINSNNAEPTVTITLKGQTPAEDKVLFTLVNGQTKEPSHKSEQEQNQSNNGKKKKVKAINSNNPLQQGNKLQQSNNSKQQTQIKANDGKNLKQQVNNEKSKNSKQADEKKIQQQNVNEGKNSKSKKDKKNTENKENVLQQQNIVNKSKNQQNASNKKQNKASTPPQTPVSQKQQQNQVINESMISKKAKKQQQQDKNLQSNTNKSNKNNNNNANNKNDSRISNKSDSQKNNVNKTNQTIINKQRVPTEVQSTCSERVSSPSLSSQFKDIGPNSKINIENLKLPPGITITKVDAPPKPLPIKTAPLPKPVNPPKQTTIIAAPMSGVQSSYASSQGGGNVIVVDTGKLKQDLLPKANEKDSSKDSQPQNITTGKKKKKKNKNSANTSGNTAVSSPVQNNDAFVNDHMIDEPARILHNPGTNMVTIRNPSFGPMKVPPTQQAAIIKVSENGMVTIRSPALQQAINAGLTSPPKPDYIVKGDLSSSSAGRTTTNDCGQLSVKHANGVISSSLAELRSRLSAQSDCTSSLSELANIQISQMTNGQPIPENGINLKGTSVTLTKVRPEATSMEDARQASAKCTAVKEVAINATLANGGGSSGKSKKKKKRGSGTGQCGDDLDLVEVFTPKDIDLENDEEMDDDERELEAFKRFCLQSVPPLHKEKVNLNIKDIVLKKKSSSSSSSSSSTSSSSTAAAAAAAAAAAVIAAN